MKGRQNGSNKQITQKQKQNTKMSKSRQQVNRLYSTKLASEKATDYLKTMIYPENFSCRIPDPSSAQTALYSSIQEFDLYANFDETTNSGRFSFLAAPKLGSTLSPLMYKTAIVNTTNGWPVNFANPSTYVQSSGGIDPRVDPNLEYLLSPPVGSSTIHGTMNTSVSGGFHFVNGDSTPLTVSNTNLNVLVDNDTQGIYVPSGSTRHTITIGSNESWYRVDGTSWSEQPILRCDLQVLSSGGAIVARYYVNATPDFGTGAVTYTWAADDQNTRLFVQNINMNPWFPTAEGAEPTYGLSNTVNFTFIANLGAGEYLRPLFSLARVNYNSTNALYYSHYIDVCSYGSSRGFTDSGAASSIRPVAMSVLVTSRLPDINNGGNIVSKLLPPGTAKQYFSVGAAGQLQVWETLAQLKCVNGQYDDNFKKGTYVFYHPFSENDYLLRTPSEANAYQQPVVVVSGQVIPGAGYSGIYNVGRVRIRTVFEWTTSVPIFETRSVLGSVSEMEAVLGLISQVNCAMENKSHIENLKAILKGFLKVAPLLLPAAQALAPHLGAVFENLASLAGNVGALL